MNFPPPTERQARVLWFSLTALAVGVLLGLIGLLVWGFGWVLSKLSAVLLPLALAAIIAYLLSPVVDFFEKKKFSRTSSVVMVFLFGFLLVVGLLATVVPRLVVETQQLIHRIPDYTQKGQTEVTEWLSKSPWPERLGNFFRSSANTTNETNATNTVMATNQITLSETNQPPITTANTPPLQTEIAQKAVSWLTRILEFLGNSTGNVFEICSGDQSARSSSHTFSRKGP